MELERFQRIAAGLVEAGRRFDARGWVLGTSGNLSAVVEREPLTLAITPSGAFKGDLTPDRILQIDATGAIVGDVDARPSAEALLHVEIVRARQAAAVFHTHSTWSTVLSHLYAADGGLLIEGYEMLKGLAGVKTHAHGEWLPIVENDQDMPRLAAVVAATLARHPDAHGFLLVRHGLYTWGAALEEARRHVEILEFLLQAVGQTLLVKNGVDLRSGDRAIGSSSIGDREIFERAIHVRSHMDRALDDRRSQD
jgi:methylthioribulose-1-phosphate dehydratase